MSQKSESQMSREVHAESKGFLSVTLLLSPSWLPNRGTKMSLSACIAVDLVDEGANIMGIHEESLLAVIAKMAIGESSLIFEINLREKEIDGL